MPQEKPPTNYKKPVKNGKLISNALFIAIETPKNKNKDLSYFVVIYNINLTYRLL